MAYFLATFFGALLEIVKALLDFHIAVLLVLRNTFHGESHGRVSSIPAQQQTSSFGNQSESVESIHTSNMESQEFVDHSQFVLKTEVGVLPVANSTDRGTKIYAVAIGVVPGTYYKYEECMAQVTGFKGAKWRYFYSMGEAETFCCRDSKKFLVRCRVIYPVCKQM